MKSAKEEAERIYSRMKGFRITNKHRKKCALVAIDEMIKLMDEFDLTGSVDSAEVCVHYNFAIEVREQIEKL